MENLSSSDHETVWNIIEQFDFERMHTVMQFLGWHWVDDDRIRTPDIRELRDRARQHLIRVVQKAREVGEWQIVCGGFEAFAIVGPDDLVASLKFVVVDSSNQI